MAIIGYTIFGKYNFSVVAHCFYDLLDMCRIFYTNDDDFDIIQKMIFWTHLNYFQLVLYNDDTFVSLV